MKKLVRSSAVIASAVFGISFATPPSAHASDSIRMMQMRLADLGYYHGPDDGTLSPPTHDAIADFQTLNGLTVNGTLDPETASMIIRTDYRLHNENRVKIFDNYHATAAAPKAAPVTDTTPAPFKDVTLDPFKNINGVTRYTTTSNVAPVTYIMDSQGYAHYVAAGTVTYADSAPTDDKAENKDDKKSVAKSDDDAKK